jgi:hypothetical protein
MRGTPRSLVCAPGRGERAVLNPLRSEEEAFRLLLYAIAVFAVIIVLIVVVRAIV